MESHNSNNNNINNQSPVSDSSDNNNSNNSPLAVTGVMAWDLGPTNVTNIGILTDEDVEMEDVEVKDTRDKNNNRKRQSTSDMVKATKVVKKYGPNDEIVAILEQKGENENIVERAWYYMYMPDGTKTAIRLVPTTTTQELNRRLREAYGNMYCVAARLQGTTEVLRLDWSMNTLDMLGVYTVIVMA